MQEQDRDLIEATAELAYCNPFLHERVDLEKRALGPDFESHGEVWHSDETGEPNPNVVRIQERLEERLTTWRQELLANDSPSQTELQLYRDVVYYTTYNRWQADLLDFVKSGRGARRVSFWPAFREEQEQLLSPTLQLPDPAAPELVLAWFFQLRRAFHFAFHGLRGSSAPVARLRGQVWQSIFTHDMRRYRRGLYSRIGDFTTLITGPSGTGKELVARAIGLSRFIPFEPDRSAFAEDFESSFVALNLSALSPTLLESELFGHRKGSFTGAVRDRQGWLESCPPLGSVFLDEIGEISLDVQVKLLRVLEARTFQRIGETDDRRFEGKLIAATNRNPEDEIRDGRMRPDFYYRICSDLVETPSLREQLSASPDDLSSLVGVIVTGLVGDDDLEPVTGEVLLWIEENLGADYDWPGNFRELEQCVRNVMVRGRYEAVGATPPSPGQELATRFEGLELGAEELLRRYVTLAYHRTGSYVATARKLDLDRRTVKAKLDRDHLEELRQLASS